MTVAPPRPTTATQLLGPLISSLEPAPAGELHVDVRRGSWAQAIHRLHAGGARFITLFVAEAPRPALSAVFALTGELLVLQTQIPPDAPLAYSRMGGWWPALDWAERELLEHDPWISAGRATATPPLTLPNPDLITRELDGLDVFTLPYGPVRSGVFEAIQFVIETGGEDVSRLHTRPFFKRRGIESRFAGVDVAAGARVAERVAGTASCAYASAFCHAVERALDVEPPRHAQAWRALHCELERIANHLDVIAKEAETAALTVGLARFQILKERVQRLRAELCGSRFGRGVILPGGISAEGAIGLDELRRELERIERELGRDQRLFLGTASMTDRLINAGQIERGLIEEHGAVGPLARGSGVSIDARHERPYGAYRRLGLRVAVHREGDAMARIQVRFEELTESLRLLRQLGDQLRREQRGELRSPLPKRGSGSACGWAEAPAGEVLFWVEAGDGLIQRVRIASPSLRNWALFSHAFPKDVLTDFAFIEHSFGLTPAGADR